MTWTLDKILKGARRFGASDAHLVRGVAPIFRIGGEIRPIEGEPLDEQTLRSIVSGMITAHQQERLAAELQLCFSRHWEDIGRCRISIYYHAGSPELAIRLCETTIRPSEQLGLAPFVEELTRLATGLVLVTGPTGVGKTTTLNYMIDVINRERRTKIVTIEDPVEFVHQNSRSVVVQQEVGTDVISFRSALIHVLRQDPDVIIIGEMRELETIETALVAAETGHLVIATLHTPDCVQTVQRIFGAFPAEQQNNIALQLANSLQAILAQKLLPRATSAGQILAMEICVATPAIRNHIRERHLHLIYNELQTGKKSKMQTMDASLLELYQRGEITYDILLTNVRDQEFIRSRIEKT
ncbi:MAG TPA: PilT/PilU family type 4a pilus ATPase [Planctomycetaceae bacterium]|nr:PilT/PilU family type 4a pilus ATPase [Planctomycetaceae bacterium]